MVLVVIKNNQKNLNTSESLDGELQLGGLLKQLGELHILSMSVNSSMKILI